MTRIRYAVDNPRGPRGGENDVRTMFSNTATAKRNVRRGAAETMGVILEIDLDDLAVVGASPCEQQQHAERMMVKWSQRVLELRSGTVDAGPLFSGAPTSSDLPAIPQLTRADLRRVADVFARWTAWCNSRPPITRGHHYQPERDLRAAICDLLAKAGEATR